jgi:hypothetical protein
MVTCISLPPFCLHRLSANMLSAEADELRLQWGKNELEEKSKPKWLVFVELVSAWLQQPAAELWALQFASF